MAEHWGAWKAAPTAERLVVKKAARTVLSSAVDWAVLKVARWACNSAALMDAKTAGRKDALRVDWMVFRWAAHLASN